MLDLSFLPAEQLDFPALLLPPPQRLPSLRRLGMRRGDLVHDGIETTSSRSLQVAVSANESQATPKQRSSGAERTEVFDRLRTSLTAVLRTPPRRYVDIIWGYAGSV